MQNQTSFLPELELSPFPTSLVLLLVFLDFPLPNIICSTTITGYSKAKVHKLPKIQQTNMSANVCRI